MVSRSLDQISADLYASLLAFLPEVLIVAVLVVLLLARVFERPPYRHMSKLALGGTLIALIAACWQLTVYSLSGATEYFPQQLTAKLQVEREIFSGLLRYDGFTIFFRIFLLMFAALMVWLTQLTGIPDRDDSPDFYTLLLGATLGMILMVSVNHLLMLFIAVEMASIPSFAMAGFLKGRRRSAEAALKYVVYGGGASGVMLYGISLLVGLFGTAHLPTLGEELAKTAAVHTTFDAHMGTVALAVLMVLVGVSFKLAAVPFQFWCPDVFEGSATEVAAFLSVASKGAALGLLVRLALALAGTHLPLAQMAQMHSVHIWLGGAIAVLAAMSATFGNLAAYAQTNLKRLLAYSTIAHAGYMMMPVAAALTLLGSGSPPIGESFNASPALQALLYYLFIYLFMNLGAFAVVAFIRNEIGSEDLRDYKGLWQACPGLTVCLAIFLLSLTGLPPLAGFFAKFYIFAVLFQAGSYNTGMYWLLGIAMINTVLSLFYYVKVLQVMILQPAEGPVAVRLPLGSPSGLYTSLVTVPVLVLGLWGVVFEFGEYVAKTVLP